MTFSACTRPEFRWKRPTFINDTIFSVSIQLFSFFVADGSFRWVSFKNNQANTKLYMHTIAEKLFGLQELKRQTRLFG